jgi:hypothetical protein
MIVHTETGSTYEITDFHVRRTNTEGVMRRDGEWVAFHTFTAPEVGKPMLFELAPLGDGDVTLRRTSVVTGVDL